MTYSFEGSDDLSNIYDVFGDDAAYTPSGGDEVPITVIPVEIDPSIMAEAPPADSMVFRVRRIEVSNPQRGDVYTISGDTWYLLESQPVGSFDEWEILVSRSDKRRIG